MTDDGFDVRTLALTLRNGAALGWHDHPWGQLVFASAGVMRVATLTATWVVPPTRAIWLPAGVVHRIEIRGDVSMRTLYIASDRASTLAPGVAALEVAPLLRELILHILKAGMLARARPEHDRLAGVLIDLINQARRQDLFLPLPSDPRARRLAERLAEVDGVGPDLATLAQAAGASLRTLQRLFPSETGLTLEAWRRKARLVNAVACLSSGASVGQAAEDCGFQSLGAFTAAFTRQFGVTPGRYGKL